MTAENVDITPKPTGPARTPSTTWSYRPRLDVIEDAAMYTVRADMPGACADDIRISFAAGVLNVHATVKPRQGTTTEFLTHEYGVGDFDCELSLSDAMAADRITAEYERGVLTIHLPKRDEILPRRIPVRETQHPG